MAKQTSKYLCALIASVLAIQLVFGTGLPSADRLPSREALLRRGADTLTELPARADGPVLSRPAADSGAARLAALRPAQPADSLPQADSLGADSTRNDSILIKNFLDAVISGKNTDSLVYRPKDKMVYIYQEGDVTYGNMNLKADLMRVELGSKQIYATGVVNDTTTGAKTRPVFTEGASSYTMDTILYNIDSGKAKIKGVATQEGEGFLLGQDVKKMPDNTINIMHGKYTTCDQTDHPHFYLALHKAKVIPQKKVITGWAYMVMEDVPLPIGVPEAFFPLTQGRSSGIIIPSYGEESARGFFLRNGGYYWAINDYVDLKLTATLYTYGSWELPAESNSAKRYRYNGRISASYAKTIIGQKGDADYVNSPSMQLLWSHSQDPKANPGTTFSASVNFTTSGYSQYVSNNLNDIVSTTTASTISYARNWTGLPIHFSATLTGSVNSRDTTITLTPTLRFNTDKLYPFRRKNPVGKQRWYEKISLSYTTSLAADLTAKEDEFFSPNSNLLDKLNSGITHSIPVSTSFNLFNYINVTPSFNYNALWAFRDVRRTYDPEAEDHERRDTTYGFHHLNSYDFNVSASTKVYGMYDFTRHQKFPLKYLRHTLTPSIGFNYTPDFGNPLYGYYLPYQTSEDGTIDYYSPYSGNKGTVPSRTSHAAAITFSLSQTLEAKVASKTDTSGMKKISIIDNFSLSGSYNFLNKEFPLSTIPLSLRMSIPGIENFNIQFTGTLDPYDIAMNENGAYERVGRLMIANGKGLGRLTNVSTTLGYTFNSGQSNQPAINNQAAIVDPFYFDPNNPLDPLTRRQMMAATYYDFSIPWNLSFSYSLSYNNPGGPSQRNVTQTLSFNTSVNITPKWGLTFNGGFDFMTGKMTMGTFTLTRDLHCWQMSFSWIPVGSRKSWQFNINVKASALQDLKYEKSSSYLDNIDW